MTALLGEKIETALREELALLPQGRAFLNRRQEPTAVVIEIVPSIATGAKLTVVAPTKARSGITVIAGQGSYFEIPQGGRRYTRLPLLDELRAICTTVIHRGLEEWVTMDGPDVIAGKGTIELDGPVTVRWRQLSIRALWRKMTPLHRRYTPWV